MGKSVRKPAAVAVAPARPPRAIAKPRVDGVVIARLASVPANGRVRIVPVGVPDSRAVEARLASRLEGVTPGAAVAVIFEGGDPERPIVIGRIEPAPGVGDLATGPLTEIPVTARLDGETVVLEATKEIVLRCGEATITLTRAGKILIQGAYVSSRSSGLNRIRGGAVQIN